MIDSDKSDNKPLAKDKSDKSNDVDLLIKARSFVSAGFGVIPVNAEKRPELGKGEVESARGQITTEEKLQEYFGAGKSPDTVGIGLLIHKTEFTVDTDQRGEWVFTNKILSRLSSSLQDKVNSTMITKTPRGYHRTFKINDPKIIVKEKTYWSEDDHNEIAVKGINHYSIETSPGYDSIRGLDSLLGLSTLEITELFKELEIFRKESNMTHNVCRILNEFYRQTNRDKVVFAVSGFCYKCGVREQLCHDLVEHLAHINNDEQSDERLVVVTGTYSKIKEEVSGRNELLSALDDNIQALDNVETILKNAGYKYPVPRTYTKSAGKIGEEEESSDNKNMVALELAMNKIEELFTDQFKETYAAINIDGHVEVLRINTSRFKNWIAGLYYREEQDVLSAENIKNVSSVLSAQAMFEGPQYKLQLRVGNIVDVESDVADTSTIYYDLANKDWQAVKITKDGWTIEQSPILFRRYSATGKQVLPVHEYDENTLDQFIGLINMKRYPGQPNKEANQKLLLKCFIVVLFIPGVQKPAQMLHGEQGSAKTSEQEAIKDLVDPSPVPTLSIPRDLNELLQQMMHNYVCFYDNISFIRDWVSDQFCRAITGSGASKRMLYSDDEDIIYEFLRVIGFNGVNIAATKPDLLDRGIIMELERIAKDKNIGKIEMKKKFAELKPQLLGYIFDVLVKVLQTIANGGIGKIKSPRMADFAEYGEIVSRCMGNPENAFLNAYYENIDSLTEEAIQAHPVSLAIAYLMSDKQSWEGSVSELYVLLQTIAIELSIDTNSKIWPKAANSLGRKINEVKTNLRHKGIVIEPYLMDVKAGIKGLRITK